MNSDYILRLVLLDLALLSDISQRNGATEDSSK